MEMTTEDFVHGSGKWKASFQRLYEKVNDCYKELKSCARKTAICGEDTNSYGNTISNQLSSFVYSIYVSTEESERFDNFDPLT